VRQHSQLAHGLYLFHAVAGGAVPAAVVAATVGGVMRATYEG